MSFTKKSRLLSFFLTLLLGPLGLLYATPVGGVIMIILAIVTFPTGFGPFIVWILSIGIGDHAAYKHNKGVDTALEAMRSGSNKENQS